MENLQGTRYVSTAAHCANNIYYAGGFDLDYVTGTESGSFDTQIHTAGSGHTIRNWAYDGQTQPNNYRQIQNKLTRAEQVVGATYCKYGRKTGYDCGELLNKNYICGTPLAQFTCMRLERFGVDMAGAGDSGGPVMTGLFALGMNHACITSSGSCDTPGETHPLVYIATNHMEGAVGPNVFILTNS